MEVFEWDAKKALINIDKHGVSFEEATTVFEDVLSATIPDRRHSANEERFITIGLSNNGRILMIAHNDSTDKIRVISAREVTSSERRDYEHARRQKRTRHR